MTNLHQNLAVIGALTSTELAAVAYEFNALDVFDLTTIAVDSGFEPNIITSFDIRQAKKYGVNFVQTIKRRRDYCAFWNIHQDDEFSVSKQCIQSRFPNLNCIWDQTHGNSNTNKTYGPSPFIFRGYYAMEHDDRGFSTSHQLMLIIENSGHRLYHEDRRTLLTPEAGDIVVLHTHKRHALFPCFEKTAAQCANAPLKFYAIPFSP